MDKEKLLTAFVVAVSAGSGVCIALNAIFELAIIYALCFSTLLIILVFATINAERVYVAVLVTTVLFLSFCTVLGALTSRVNALGVFAIAVTALILVVIEWEKIKKFVRLRLP